MSGDFVRFIIAGTLNTAATILLYYILLYVFNPTAAYIVSWLVGLAGVIAFYPSFIFRRAPTAGARFAVLIAYGITLGISTLLLKLLIVFNLPPEWAIYPTTAAGIIINFLLMQGLLRLTDKEP